MGYLTPVYYGLYQYPKLMKEVTRTKPQKHEKLRESCGEIFTAAGKEAGKVTIKLLNKVMGIGEDLKHRAGHNTGSHGTFEQGQGILSYHYNIIYKWATVKTNNSFAFALII